MARSAASRSPRWSWQTPLIMRATLTWLTTPTLSNRATDSSASVRASSISPAKKATEAPAKAR